MRVPDAKMVQDYSNFKLGTKEGDELMQIEPWNSSMGAKGKLQVAWFKVSGILGDQRSLRTIAKVGGLVGKTVEIDENTRFRHDFVRVKIACRDLSQVPPSAECNLGLFIYDFFFEIEKPDQQKIQSEKLATKAGGHEGQPTPKKMRTEKDSRFSSGGGGKNNDEAGSSKGGGGGEMVQASMECCPPPQRCRICSWQNQFEQRNEFG